MTAFEVAVFRAIQEHPGESPSGLLRYVYPDLGGARQRAGKIAHVSMACDRLVSYRRARSEMRMGRVVYFVRDVLP